MYQLLKSNYRFNILYLLKYSIPFMYFSENLVSLRYPFVKLTRNLHDMIYCKKTTSVSKRYLFQVKTGTFMD